MPSHAEVPTWVNPICREQGHAAPNANPRSAGNCSRCGLPLPNTDMPRDPAAEAAWTEEAATLAKSVNNAEAVAHELSRLSGARMGDGPWQKWGERHWPTEGIEEIADNRSYAVAEMLLLKQEEAERDDEDYWAEVMALRWVLATTIIAFDAWQRYQELRSRR